MKVLFFPSDNMGCGTYRVHGPALALQAAGIECRFIPQDMLSRVRQIQVHADLVVIQRPLHPAVPWIVHACQSRGVPVVYELDDDVFHVPYQNPARAAWTLPHAAAQTRHLLQQCAHVIVSTDALKASILASSGIPADKVTVCYNHLRPEFWGPDVTAGPQVDNRGRVVIGWHGSVTHESDFRVALVALKQIVKACPQVMLRFFGSAPEYVLDQLPSDRVHVIDGVPFAQFPRALHTLHFNIGIAPLVSHPFNESKSGLKFLEYAALKVPTVASDCTSYRLIRPGVTGYLCQTAQEWFDALLKLVAAEGLRRQMGQAAYDDAWATWGPSRGDAWVALVQRLLSPVPAHA